MIFSGSKKRKLGDEYVPEKLFFQGYDYSVWSQNKKESSDKEESTDKGELTDIQTMPLLEGDEEEVKLKPGETIVARVKLNPRKRKNVGKGSKILTANKLHFHYY